MGMYQSDVHMNTSIIHKPMHEGSLWRHHIWVLFCLPGGCLLSGQLWTGISGRIFSESSAMRRRIKFGWLFEDEGSGGLFGGFVGGIADS
jgi:hypothetical protein